MRRMPQSSFDVVITSPPYNIGIAYASYEDRKPEEAYMAWLGEVFAEIKRVLNPEGQFFLNIGGQSRDPSLPYRALAVAQRHFVLQNDIIWAKSVSFDNGQSRGHFKPINSKRFLNNVFEHVFHLTPTGAVEVDRLAIGVPFADATNATRWSHGKTHRCRGNLWHVPYETIQNRSKERGAHPATFPVRLAEMCIKLAGVRPGLRVLDPFLGTGTTLVACQKLRVEGTGCELDPGYAAYARDRLSIALALQRDA